MIGGPSSLSVYLPLSPTHCLERDRKEEEMRERSACSGALEMQRLVLGWGTVFGMVP